MRSERSDVREVVDCADHSLGLLNGLARLRQSGLLLDTLLRAEGVAFQVNCQLGWIFRLLTTNLFFSSFKVEVPKHIDLFSPSVKEDSQQSSNSFEQNLKI